MASANRSNIMDFKDVTKNLAGQTDYRLEQRFNEMLRRNPSYKNLNAANQELIKDIIEEYREKIRHGIKPSYTTIKQRKYYFYSNHVKLGLTYYDLEQINKLLDSFKSI